MDTHEKKIKPRQPLSEDEQKMLEKIDDQREALVDLIQKMVQIDSVNIAEDVYNERNDVFRFLEKTLKKMGMDVNPIKVNFPGGSKDQYYINLMAGIDGKNPGKRLQFNGHLDTVSYNTDNWHKDTLPTSGVIKDGMLYGRGAADMKSGVAAMVIAMKTLKDCGADFNGRLQLWCTPDEETHGAYGSDFMVKNHPEIVKTDATIISEARSQPPLQTPTITVGEKGPHWLRFTFYGASGHGSIPKPLSNAINKAVQFMANAEEFLHIPFKKIPLNTFKYFQYYLKRYKLFDLVRLLLKKKVVSNPYEKDVRKLRASFETSYSFDVIRAGRKVNIVPDVCDLDVDFRVVPGLSTQGLMDSISAYCTLLGYKVDLPGEFENKQNKQSKFREAPVDVRVSVITIGEGFMVDKDSEFGTCLQEAFEAVYETTPVPTFSSGFSDAGNMLSGGMQEVFNIGPQGYNIHNANEHVNIESVVTCAKLYLLTAYRYLNS
jgi:succinyl-diaminopimelate desuccinylase